MTAIDWSARLDLARRAGREAGQATLRYFQRPEIGFERKGDSSPVTVADREAEQLLRRAIAAAFPQDGILGEEFGSTDGTSGVRWILDPIDGTKAFISGVPLYGTMIGIEHEGRSVVGLIYVPALDEGVYAAAGQGAWYVRGTAAPVPARVSARKRLADGIFLTSQVDSFEQRGADEAFRGLQRAAYVTRTWGDCYGYLLVATGRCDVMVDPVMNVWDAAAIQPILEEAGGTFTDWSGAATIHGGEGIGTNGHLLDEVLAFTRPFARK